MGEAALLGREEVNITGYVLQPAKARQGRSAWGVAVLQVLCPVQAALGL